MSGPAPSLPELIDRKGLMGLGLGEESVERMKVNLPTIHLPGDRKRYWRREEVAAYLDRHTVPPMRGAA